MPTPSINLKMKSVYVEPKVIKSRFTVKQGPPVIQIYKGCRGAFGLSNPIKYWWWQQKQKWNWKNKNK